MKILTQERAKTEAKSEVDTTHTTEFEESSE